MDSFAKRYLMVLGTIVVVAIAWILLGSDERVGELNTMLAEDSELRGYPYGFRVFRLEDGKMVEHWDIIQEVPTEGLANTNGMFTGFH